MRLRQQTQKLARLSLLASALLLCLLLVFGLSTELSKKRIKDQTGRVPELSLDSPLHSHTNGNCDDRIGVPYLQGFRHSYAQYCSSDAKNLARMSCFSNSVDPKNGRTDTFCIAGPAVYSTNKQKFSVDCKLKPLSEAELQTGAQPFNRFPPYWYQTGPRYIFDHYVDLNVEDAFTQDPIHGEAPTAVLIKRENANFNMWHSLMEIMSAYWSLLILSQTTDSQSGQPLYSYSEPTQILILDDIADGPYWGMWTLVASDPPRRLLNLASQSINHSISIGRMIVPLPGGSNPFWQGDWIDLNCTSSTLLEDFSRKALDRYNISPMVELGSNAPITLTYINRVIKRRLVDQDQYIDALRNAHPSIAINVVDYASLPFQEQLQISATTDILVGVHGAGLTHTMFLPHGSGAVVELMPFNVDHHGFKNLAKMRSLQYYQTKTADAKHKTQAKGNWQDDDVWVDQQAFMATIGEAIENLRQTRGLTK